MLDHRSAGLSDEQAVAIYRWMLLTRRLDERLSLLQRSGAIPLAVSSRGHEAAQVGAATAFTRGQDWWFPYYRDLGAVLVAGSTPLDVMLSAFGRAADPSSGGRQTPYNWGDRRLNIVARSAPVGVQIPQAVGAAQAAVRRGDRVVVYCSFGEGAASQGDFHEGLNWAALYRLPVVFLCQNNGWAISVPVSRQLAGGSVAARAAGYGIEGICLDGGDPFAVHAAVRRAVARARAGGGPALIEARVHRMDAHTCDDNHTRYRSPEELAEVQRADPLPRVAEYLRRVGLLREGGEAALERAVAAAIDRAEEQARAAPLPPPEHALEP
ncbi:2-oxoisovalerate dehydrogenase E1 component alpha subunit [Symbiobacterium terraclitae]|uniref:2-oxoisovalerate dehydrogenase subunit alpha n=1 Tax=Symbiobacterium terraclitae TaxID=557451 RepID=A0ABS4JPU6_9FIRM|nr:2-oxoisovalerate dehydrogenase E1 component alpha subunit [Symbiobacterium terraclitae]